MEAHWQDRDLEVTKGQSPILLDRRVLFFDERISAIDALREHGGNVLSAGIQTAEMSTAAQEWRAGWPLALACLSGMTIASMAMYVLGPMIEPLEAEFGWSRAQISMGITVSTLCSAVMAPLVGMMIDRWGPRRIGLPGAVLALLGFSSIALATESFAVWIAIWAVISIGAVGIKPTVWTMAIATTFNKARGLAMAVALCGSSLAALVMPILSTMLIDAYGWRPAMPVISGIVALVVVPILYFGLRTGADASLQGKESQQQVATPHAARGATVRAAVRSAQFIKLGLAAFIFTVCALGLVANLVPMMSSLDLSRAEAAGIAGLLGIASFTGRIGTGYLLDRFSSGIVGGMLVLMPVISCLLLLNADGSALIASLAVLIFGLALGAEVDVIAYVAAEKFGTARYGTIFGFITTSWYLATAAGPVLTSLIYDISGNYELALKIAIPAFLTTSVLLFTIGKPLPFDEPAQTR